MCVHGAPFLPRCATSGRVALSRTAHYSPFLAWTQTPQPQAPQSLSAKGAGAKGGVERKSDMWVSENQELASIHFPAFVSFETCSKQHYCELPTETCRWI